MGKYDSEKTVLVEKQEQHYEEVMNKLYKSLKLFGNYEESFKIYKAAQPDPDLANKEAKEKAKKLKDEEELQKQEYEAAVKMRGSESRGEP